MLVTVAFNEYARLQNYSNLKTNNNLYCLWLSIVVNSVTIVRFRSYTLYCCKPLSQHCSENVRWTGRSYGASYRISTRRSINQRSIVEIHLYNFCLIKTKPHILRKQTKFWLLHWFIVTSGTWNTVNYKTPTW